MKTHLRGFTFPSFYVIKLLQVEVQLLGWSQDMKAWWCANVRYFSRAMRVRKMSGHAVCRRRPGRELPDMMCLNLFPVLGKKMNWRKNSRRCARRHCTASWSWFLALWEWSGLCEDGLRLERKRGTLYKAVELILVGYREENWKVFCSVRPIGAETNHLASFLQATSLWRGFWASARIQVSVRLGRGRSETSAFHF